MRKSSTLVRLLGIPRAAARLEHIHRLVGDRPGSERRTGPPRSHSSWKGPNRPRSAKPWIFSRGSQSSFAADSSQKGQPVAGSKCHWTTSRVQASTALPSPHRRGLPDGAVGEIQFPFHSRHQFTFLGSQWRPPGSHTGGRGWRRTTRRWLPQPSCTPNCPCSLRRATPFDRPCLKTVTTPSSLPM